MRSRLTCALFAVLIVVFLVDCGDGGPPGDGADTESPGDADVTDTAADEADRGGDVTAEPDGEGQEPTEIVAGDPTLADSLAGTDGTAGYFFEAIEGDWLLLRVGPDVDAGSSMEPRLTLDDPSGLRLAENDHVIPGNGPAEIAFRAPGDGRYTVWVEDVQGRTGADMMFRLSLVDFESDVLGALEEEAGDDADSATDVAFQEFGGVLYARVGGEFESGEDVDVFAINHNVPGDWIVSAFVARSGVEGSGSTAALGTIWLTDEEGAVLGRLDQTAYTNVDLRILLQQRGVVYLWIAHPDGSSGANDFYSIYLRRWRTAGALGTDDGNNTRETAVEAPFYDDEAGGYWEIHTRLDHAGDVGFFALGARGSGDVRVSCASAAHGTGLQGLRAELWNDDDEVLAEDEESGSASGVFGLRFEYDEGEVEAPYWVRLSADGQSPEVASDWVYCVARRP